MKKLHDYPQKGKRSKNYINTPKKEKTKQLHDYPQKSKTKNYINTPKKVRQKIT